MAHIQIVNPNTSAATTAMMAEMARAALPANVSVTGLTAGTGAPLIVDPAALAIAADAVLALEDRMTGDAIIVAAFGDPGADALRKRLTVPVIGIGEASIRAAAERGRRFSIATTTPLLVPAIRSRVAMLGFEAQLGGIHVSSQDPALLTADAHALEAALAELIDRCIAVDRAEAVIIGGGPLSRAARALAATAPVAIMEPVPEAAMWAMQQLRNKL